MSYFLSLCMLLIQDNNTSMHPSIHPTHSSSHPAFHLSTHPTIYLLTCPSTSSPTHPLTHPPSIQSIYSLTHPPTPSSTHPPTHHRSLPLAAAPTGGGKEHRLWEGDFTILPDLSCETISALVKQGSHAVIQWVHVLHQPLIGFVVNLKGTRQMTV